MCYAIWADDKPVMAAQYKKLSKTELISKAILRRTATFTDKMYSLLSYVRAFKEYYDVRFVDVRIMGSMEVTMPSKFLAVISRTTQIRYVIVCKVKIKY